MMPEEKIAAFLEEFPWVRRYVTWQIKQVYVSRITPKLLSKEPFRSEEIYLIGKDGRCIPIEEGILWDQKTIGTGRSIWSALHSLELRKAPPVHFILSYLGTRYGGTIGCVIVYKPPQGASVMEFVRQQIDAEKAKIRQECAAIDSEASITA